MSCLLRACREAAGDRQTFDLRYADGVVAACGALEPERGDQVFDLGGAFVSPGLIDAHVHLGLGGPPEAAARASFAAGLTAVRDLGGVYEADPEDPLGALGPPDARHARHASGPPNARGLAPLRTCGTGVCAW